VKAISIRQPWASLIASGHKTIETRTWPTPYRGDLLICAARNPAPGCNTTDLPTGVALAIVRLVDSRPMRAEDVGAANRPFDRKLWSWFLTEVRPIEPFVVRGQLRLFEVDDHLILRAKRPARSAGRPAAVGQGLLY
jgi:ASCH domain-containing protein